MQFVRLYSIYGYDKIRMLFMKRKFQFSIDSDAWT